MRLMRPPFHFGKILTVARVRHFLVTAPVNILYLTGVDLSAAALLISEGKAELFVDGRYLEAAKSTCFPGVVVRPLKEWVSVLRDLRIIGFEGNRVTVDRLLSWQRKFKNTKFVHKSGIIEEFRGVKSSEELSVIEEALQMTHAILAKVPRLLCVGTAEREVALTIESFAVRAGADGMAFPTIVAFGRNTSYPHHHPGKSRLRKGDIVQVDMGVRLRGYCSDVSRVFFTAEPTREQRKALRAVKRAKRAAEAALRPGVTNHTLDRIAREELAKSGMEEAFTHSLGHGLGLEIHEQPSLSGKAPLIRLRRRQVVTIEPGVYFPGSFGIRLEDTHIVS
jgi:Xaa-Pro aminopeptidase/Xaa-Pro dipeptidase